MKNVTENKKRTCLVFDMQELENILCELFKDKVTIRIIENEFDVSFDKYEPDPALWYDEITEKLSEYFDINVTSIHVDQWDYPLVWIVYKDK